MSTFFETLTVHDAHLANSNRPRQRITRACDQCHELRTRCNGNRPCNRCFELSTKCEYNRKPKKRGKASGRAVQSPRNNSEISHDSEPGQHSGGSVASAGDDQASNLGNLGDHQTTSLPRSAPTPDVLSGSGYSSHGFDITGNSAAGQPTNTHQLLPTMAVSQQLSAPSPENLRGPNFGHIESPPSFQGTQQMQNGDLQFQSLGNGANSNAFAPSLPSPHGSDNSALDGFFQGPSFPGQPRPWSAKGTPRPFSFETFGGSLIAADMKMKYSVLTPLMPHLINIISLSLANELLEYYFATFSGSSTHPLSPYVQTFILRKNSVLHPTNPRRCTPALLSSMLWLAAQTSEAPALTDGPSSRARICQKLLDLTMDLLKPLRHHSEGQVGTVGGPQEGERPREHHYGLPSGLEPSNAGEKSAISPRNIDNIITYLHLGTVFSASEHKASSIRWWSVAWAMARDMKLNKELPYSTNNKDSDEAQLPELRRDVSTPSQEVTEEQREERRRIWWLLYMCDRHLSLCYNQPLSLTDVECETLLQPLDERMWQHSGSDDLEHILRNTESRPRGPQTKCYNLSLFGYFLPLMTILGGIMDLIRAKTHPRFGRYSQANPLWDELAGDISAQLEEYRYTLEQLGEEHVQMDRAEDALQQRIAVAYGRHIMHVMHILMSGKWDPIVLHEDEDHWVGSQSFIITTKHATSAAEEIPNIFDNDLDLSFMTWYWGIYLLHGSFLLLFVADKLRDQITPQILGACQSIIRAHEACAVTLDNEYQRNFRKIMITAVAQIKGRRTEDNYLLQQRRREVLSLYRWIGGGGGLAL